MIRRLPQPDGYKLQVSSFLTFRRDGTVMRAVPAMRPASRPITGSTNEGKEEGRAHVLYGRFLGKLMI